MTDLDGALLADIVAAIPGVRRLYAPSSPLAAAAGSAVPSTKVEHVKITDEQIFIRLGIDHSRPIRDITSDIHQAVTEHLGHQSDNAKTIHLEVATIR